MIRTCVVPNITLADLPTTLRKRTFIDTETRCWRAEGGFIDPDGYAQYRRNYAHREMWKMFVGPVDDEWQVDHVYALGCRYRSCIWISHLQPVPVAINCYRSTSPTARNAAKQVCDFGHDFDLFNTRWNTDGSRTCRACERRRRRLAKMALVPSSAATAELGDAWDALAEFGRAA